MTKPNESSHAALITELTEMRRHLWTAIAQGKQIAHLLPARDRSALLSVLMEAERFMAGGINISPSAPGRSTPLAGGSVAPGANSSERAADQKPTPGEKRIGTSTSDLHRRVKDSGDAFEERLKET